MILGKNKVVLLQFHSASVRTVPLTIVHSHGGLQCSLWSDSRLHEKVSHLRLSNFLWDRLNTEWLLLFPLTRKADTGSESQYLPPKPWAWTLKDWTGIKQLIMKSIHASSVFEGPGIRPSGLWGNTGITSVSESKCLSPKPLALNTKRLHWHQSISESADLCQVSKVPRPRA